MVISASRREDMPAYRADWLMERIEAGGCTVRNPFDARRARWVSLAPEDVDFLVLWTRNPRPLVPRLAELDARGLRYYFQVTLTAYPSAIEPGAPSLQSSIDALCELSDAIGPRRALWRYDPVFVAEGLDSDFHRRSFEDLAAALEGRTLRVTLSLLDEYAGTAARLARAGFPGAVFGSRRGEEAGPAPPEPYPSLLSDLAAIARSRGMTPVACAEPYDLSALGIEAEACVDAGLAASLWGSALAEASAVRKDPGQRPACRCGASVDIGAYGPCPRACAYCYARRR